jgi:hypothetical protein
MAEYVFAVDCTEADRDMVDVKRMLRRNYDQWCTYMEDKNDPNWDSSLRPRLLEVGTSWGGEDTYAWYVNTDPVEFAKYEDSDVLEPIDG